MQIPLQLTFRGLESTPALEELVRDRAQSLEHFHPHVLACRVLIEQPQHHHHAGKAEVFNVRIDVTVRGKEIVVKHVPKPHREHETLEVAVRRAFDATKRQLQDSLRERRGFVKHHEAMPEGRIVRLLPERDCGFIEAEGREIYFHRNSLLDGDFDLLEPGHPVRFVEEAGERGPQASTVHAARPKAAAPKRTRKAPTVTA